MQRTGDVPWALQTLRAIQCSGHHTKRLVFVTSGPPVVFLFLRLGTGGFVVKGLANRLALRLCGNPLRAAARSCRSHVERGLPQNKNVMPFIMGVGTLAASGAAISPSSVTPSAAPTAISRLPDARLPRRTLSALSAARVRLLRRRR